MSVSVSAAEKRSAGGKRRRKYSKEQLHENVELYLIMLPVLILIFLMCYLPLYGLVIAFQDYSPGMPFFSLTEKIKWVGFKHFATFISGKYFGRLMRNTILLSVYNLVFGFWVPIVFALLLNEVQKLRFKKFVQTASYLPYFISSVVVAGMVLSFIDTGGIINKVIALFGGTATPLNTSPTAFPVVYTITNIWKSFGWNSILYLSTMSSIDPALYESARLDGANRLQQMWYVTIPSILPTIAMMFIMAVGGILGSNTDLILLLYNTATYPTADVIGTYIYRVGLEDGKFSYTSAVGIFSSVINFVLVFIANAFSNKVTNYGLF